MVARKNIGIGVCACLGAVFLVTGCVLIHVFTELIHDEVDSNIPLKKGSASYKHWQNVTTPIYFQVWFWDIVNPEEVIAGKKPTVMQIGPYTYRESREKVDVTFHDNGTVSYKENRYFTFDRDMSVGTENDTFHTVNLPMLTIISMLKNEFYFFKKLADDILKHYKESIIMKLSVYDLLWGYKDNMLSKIAEDLKHLPIPLNISIPEYFGLFYEKNGTDDGVYEIYSGQKGVSNFGKIASWNGQKALDYWTTALANSINGTDGTIYPPFIDTGKTKYLFSSDICRSLGMDYTKGVKNRGIDMDRFVAPPILFGNVTVNPYNKGFCTPADNCLPSGLLNVESCRSGAPIVMSMPHCLGCDEKTLNSIRGYHPNKEEHQSFIDLEPMTGVVMNAGKRLQINIFMHEISGFPETKNFKPMYMPLMWLNESAMIGEKDAKDFKDEVYGKMKLTNVIKFGLVALGGLMIIFVLGIILKARMCPKEEGLSINSRDIDNQQLISDSAIA